MQANFQNSYCWTHH